MDAFCGIDWAEDHHDVALVDRDGGVLARLRISDDAAGLARLLELLAGHGDNAENPIPVAIETPRGLLVACLRAGRQVYPVNPMAVARYRDRHSVAGRKSDKGDAAILANVLRTDSHVHRPLPADSELAQAIAVLARAQQDAVWDRVAAHNKLRSHLREYYPGFLAAFALAKGGIMRPEARAGGNLPPPKFAVTSGKAPAFPAIPVGVWYAIAVVGGLTLLAYLARQLAAGQGRWAGRFRRSAVALLAATLLLAALGVALPAVVWASSWITWKLGFSFRPVAAVSSLTLITTYLGAVVATFWRNRTTIAKTAGTVTGAAGKRPVNQVLPNSMIQFILLWICLAFLILVAPWSLWPTPDAPAGARRRRRRSSPAWSRPLAGGCSACTASGPPVPHGCWPGPVTSPASPPRATSRPGPGPPPSTPPPATTSGTGSPAAGTARPARHCT